MRNLAFHWRGNLAVMLGVAVGSAVLTGALLVGDSLRGSLRERVEGQLGGIDSAALCPRPIRVEIAAGLPGRVAPVLLLPGSLQSSGATEMNSPYLGRVTVIGTDERFKPSSIDGIALDWNGTDKQVVVSNRVAERLRVGPGDTVTLGVERFSDLPRTSSVARRSASDVTATEEVVVAAVLPVGAAGNDFNLSPDPAAPLNVFLPIRTLTRLASGDREPITNALLSSGPGGGLGHLDSALRSQLRVEDYGLKLREIERKGYVSIESDQLIVPDATVAAIESAASDIGLLAKPTIAYIADTLSAGERKIPYPVVVALDPAAPAPLGPFLPAGVNSLGDDEIVLLEWPGSELNGLRTGSRIRLDYFNPEVEGVGKKETAELTLRGYIPLAGAAQDRDLVPEIRGVTDPRANLYDWDRPPVLPKEEIKKRVPDKHPRADFFNRNKATPMAYVNLATGRRLFGSRFGAVTSIRVAPRNGESLNQTTERLRPALLDHLDPAASGLVFEPIRERLLAASRGGTDFGGLFLGFSLFLIGSALMLVGLLFRLTLDRRAKEVGLLLAVGYRVRTVRQLLLAEAFIIATLGSAIGLGLGVLYNRLLLGTLLSLWPDREVANFLRPHSASESFAIGFGASVIMAMLALWLSARAMVRAAPPALLRGESRATSLLTDGPARPWIWVWIAVGVVGIAFVMGGKLIPGNPDYQAMTFFAGGGLCLVAGLGMTWSWMKRSQHRTLTGRGTAALGRLASRNAARNPVRSLLTMALLASAAFLLVAVESFRRQTSDEFFDVTGGSGGFNLIAETDVPLFQSFGDPLGRQELEARLRKLAGTEGDRLDSSTGEALRSLEGTEVFPLRLRDGDDASCMNLFQATRPRVLGIPQSLIDRGGFKFYEPSTTTLKDTQGVWARLLEPQPDGAIPVFCEHNTAQWMLKTTVGGVITVPAEDETELKLRIMATFSDSPFQSELLMADSSFAKAFPSVAGYRSFLIHTPPDREAMVSRVLSTGYRANGIIVTPTRDKVAAYQAVIGAYLSTFQLLGGLGLLLGVLGIAVVVLRAIWERIGELALLRAVGYRTRELQLLILAENALVLVLGLAIGVVTALISIAPHVASGAQIPGVRLAAILTLVFVVGLVVATGATASILRVPVIPALRRE